jgi:hypothetical protein
VQSGRDRGKYYSWLPNAVKYEFKDIPVVNRGRGNGKLKPVNNVCQLGIDINNLRTRGSEFFLVEILGELLDIFKIIYLFN